MSYRIEGVIRSNHCLIAWVSVVESQNIRFKRLDAWSDSCAIVSML